MPDTLMLSFPTSERTAPAQDAALLLDKLMSSSLTDWVSAATAQPTRSDARDQRPSTPDRLPPRSRRSWSRGEPLSSSNPVGETSSEEEALAMVLERAELSYAAWLVRDQVQTACCRFDSVAGRRACPSARVRDVRRATERAALALLARPSLGPTVFRTLYGGFQNVLPIDDSRSPS